MNDFLAAIEIGTSRTVLATGEPTKEGRIKVTGHASIPSSGVRKSQILDIGQATRSIRSVLHDIEKRQPDITIHIRNAYLVVSGCDIRTNVFNCTAPIADGRVTNDEINAAINAAHSRIYPDRELLEIAEQSWGIDDVSGIASPLGMSGRMLSLDALHIHADANRINDARTAAAEAKLEISDPLFAATCAAEAVLAPEDKQNGALVIDIGGGSTGFAIYLNGFLAHAGVLGVGGDHVTNDIAHAFQTTQFQAEILKTTYASAVLGGEDDRVNISGSSPMTEFRNISRQSLNIVVNARLRELFRIIRQQVEEAGLLHRLDAGVFITGGGASMRGIDALIRRELGIAVRFGKPVNVDGLADEKHSEALAAVSGALMYGLGSCEDKSFLRSIFGGLFRK